MTKICSRCKETLDEEEFNWKIKNVKRSCYCRDCSRKYVRSHYIRNHDYYIQKAKKRDKFVKDIYHNYICEYFRSHPCVDCGEMDILVLEFDHRDRSQKEMDISSLMRRGFPLQALKDEIAKCEVRCANCHRRKTSTENDSWKLNYAPVAQ